MNDVLKRHTNYPSMQDFVPNKAMNKWYIAAQKKT
jgi:hypothetical protein